MNLPARLGELLDERGVLLALPLRSAGHHSSERSVRAAVLSSSTAVSRSGKAAARTSWRPPLWRRNLACQLSFGFGRGPSAANGRSISTSHESDVSRVFACHAGFHRSSLTPTLVSRQFCRVRCAANSLTPARKQHDKDQPDSSLLDEIVEGVPIHEQDGVSPEETTVTQEYRIKLAMGQMLVEGGQLQENLDRAADMIVQAGRQQCQIVVLPECLDVGWTNPAARDLAAEIPGPTSEVLCRAASEAGLYVVGGLTEQARNRIYNAAVLIDPSGVILLKHRKINLLDIEQSVYCTGDRLAVAETACGVIGVNICADNCPDSLVLGHSLARMGAQVLLSPSAWAVPAEHDPMAEPYGALWEGSYRSLASLYEMPVVGVSNVGWITGGPWAGRKCIGCSLTMGADGAVLAKGTYGVDAQELIVVEIALRPRTVAGTDIAPMLRGKGYKGP